MALQITLRNYRCFSDQDPARFIVSPGVVAFVGTNNSGKSTILRFFYEFRHLIGQLAHDHSDFVDMLNSDQHRSFSYPSDIGDASEVFCNINERDTSIDFEIIHEDLAKLAPVLTRLQVTIPRNTNTKTLNVWIDGASAQFPSKVKIDNNMLVNANSPQTGYSDVAFLLEELNPLANTMYIGAFRNAVNIGC